MPPFVVDKLVPKDQETQLNSLVCHLKIKTHSISAVSLQVITHLPPEYRLCASDTSRIKFVRLIAVICH